MLRYLVVLLLLFTNINSWAQFTVPSVNNWRVHLSYTSNTSVVRYNNLFYVGSQSGVFSYDSEDGSVEVLSKVTGLSDVEVAKLAFDEQTETLVIIYKNTNIDLLQNGRIYNIQNVLSQAIMGEKTIYDVYIENGIAFLACSFGIVKIDLSSKQIVDSYQNIGPNGSNLNVKDVIVFNQFIYAASQTGLYRANINSGNLNDFNFWIKTDTLSCNQLCIFNNKLYAASYATLYVFNNNIFDSVAGATDGVKPITNLVSNANGVLVVAAPKLTLINQSGVVKFDYYYGLTDAVINDKLDFCATINGQGLVILENPQTRFIGPQGPFGNTACKFYYNATKKQLFAAAGLIDGFGGAVGWKNTYNNHIYHMFDGQNWYTPTTLNNAYIQQCYDVIDVVGDEKSNKTYFTSYGKGLLEITGTNPTMLYDTSNSKLGYFVNEFQNYRPIFAIGAALDSKANLWVTCFGASNPLSLKTTSGQWYDFAFKSGNTNVGRVYCDNTLPRNNKWITNNKADGLYVFNEGNNLTDASDDNFAILTTEKGKGFLPSKNVLCMAMDNNGEFWIGTDRGLCKISNPSAVFSNKNYDATQIVFNTGSFNSVFLGTDAILCIKVDGANRKWIGTRNGVWLVSDDGYTVIRNFTTQNSPLLSDVVYDIGIFEETGEVFFATEKGIISYAGDATKASTSHGKVVIYPNPVKPEYKGEIAIRGLANESNVKITDIAGNLVYETKANGGMATWNGNNFSGKRAATGVYLVYSSNDDATETYVTKLLLVN